MEWRTEGFVTDLTNWKNTDPYIVKRVDGWFIRFYGGSYSASFPTLKAAKAAYMVLR